MSIFDVLTMIGGLCLFLFGMDLMGQALERRAGGRLRTLLDKMTGRVMTGFLTGMAITAVIQSSSATTVMVVGFVNSGLMTLRQAINVIMGANVGTTVTAWLLSLAGISSGNVWIDLLKPTSFTPVLALVGIILYMSCKSGKRKDTGVILLGFATLMFGMDTMSGAVAGLKDVPAFAQLFVAFKNPVLGVLAGAVLTGIIQSSSASVGILQALAVTGQVSYAAAIPIIMGQNIGTCVTALLSSVGTNKNAKRAAVVHLMFNVIGVVVLLTAFCIVKAVFAPALLQAPATMYGIAVAHSCFNVICTALLLPCGGLLEKLAVRLVPDGPREMAEQPVELDERLLATPPLALQQCRAVAEEMAACAAEALNRGLDAFSAYTPELAEGIRRDEKRCDRYEDALGTYLVRLSTQQMGAAESEEATELLKTIGDFERISDHAVNVLESAEELRTKGLTFSKTAQRELDVLSKAVRDILTLALRAFREKDMDAAGQVEPLEQVIDDLKEQMRTRHILRLQQGQCSIETGFVWCDLLTDLERTSDHCSNIAGCVIDAAQHDLNLHETLRSVRHSDGTYRQRLDACAEVYRLPPPEQA
jgi:phosphate:Na+ symporter